MLRNASAIKGYAIAANDGRLGTMSDFLFDDASWIIRWLIVDTGNWLSGRKVLLPLAALGQPDPARREFPVKLTMQQVKDSPDVDTDQPVSRQIQTYLYNHYGFYPYPNEEDSHLRSVEAVTGYHIHASDGEIGHVADFLVEDSDWSIHEIVVDTKNWWPGKNVLISPRLIREIDWMNNMVKLNVDRERVKDSPAFDASTTVDQALHETFP
jgi:PRC-barrel domain